MNKRNIYYYRSETSVCLGDRVEKRGWLRKRKGRVNYVPGISKINQDMEFNGLQYVGIELEDGGVFAVLVNPESFFLKKNIHFLRRDASRARAI